MHEPSWNFSRQPTSGIDRPEGLGDIHFELAIEECVLPYLSRDNAKILKRLILDAIESRGEPVSGRISVGDEFIAVERQADRIVIEGAKKWSFSLGEAEKPRLKIRST